ncbi:uncharacterized protein LOC124418118 [Gallus gallus]|uniref:uncharacterized protein LOC124418118 n=1 Tax=Gallus gallus TaxID=9031 RepID=UPI001F0196AC|nr:uncharacterized protein LOC124418118 [Gallus gallus]
MISNDVYLEGSDGRELYKRAPLSSPPLSGLRARRCPAPRSLRRRAQRLRGGSGGSPRGSRDDESGAPGVRRLPSGLRHLGGDSGSIPFHSVLQQLNCERTETRLHRSRFDLKPFGESFAGRQRGEIRSKQWRAVSRENKSVTFYRLPGAGHGAASGGALGAPLCSSSNALERFKVNVDGVTRLCPTGVVVVIRESGCAAHCSPLLRDLIRTAPAQDLWPERMKCKSTSSLCCAGSQGNEKQISYRFIPICDLML